MARTPAPRGICPVCRGDVALRSGGVLRGHGGRWSGGIWAQQCAGSGQPPAGAPVSRVELVHHPDGNRIAVPAACLDLPLTGACVRAWLTEGA